MRKEDLDWALDPPPECRCHWARRFEDDGWYLVAIEDDCPVHPLADPEKEAS